MQQYRQTHRLRCILFLREATPAIKSNPMKYRTIKAVRAELHCRGGWLETIRDTEAPEYAPHLTWEEMGHENGCWIRDELLDWANKTL
jgi:hypothetical protein